MEFFGNIEPGAEVVPEGDAELGAGLEQAEESVAAIAADVASGAAADFSLGDLAANIVFRAVGVGVHGNLGPVEDHEQFGPVGMQPFQQPVEHNKAGALLENGVKAQAQVKGAAGRGLALVAEKIAVQSPDQSPDFFLRPPVVVGYGRELVDQPLGMNPAQDMMSDIELAGIVAGDDAVAQKTMRLDRPPKGSFSGDFHWLGHDSEPCNAEALQMRRPCGGIGKMLAGMGGKLGNHKNSRKCQILESSPTGC